MPEGDLDDFVFKIYSWYNYYTYVYNSLAQLDIEPDDVGEHIIDNKHKFDKYVKKVLEQLKQKQGKSK